MYPLLVILIIFISFAQATAQTNEDLSDQNLPSPHGALLRSFVLPGWGHQYIDKHNWTRGQYHMAADVAMILTYVGITTRTTHLESNLETFAMSKAHTDLSSRGREYRLAVAGFNTLTEYNDYQLRSRNWDNLIADTPDNQWNWESTSERLQHQDMRERIDRNNNQLPGILTLMVANRVLSGLNSFVRARNLMDNPPAASFSYLNESGQRGVTANIRFNF